MFKEAKTARFKAGGSNKGKQPVCHTPKDPPPDPDQDKPDPESFIRAMIDDHPDEEVVHPAPAPDAAALQRTLAGRTWRHKRNKVLSGFFQEHDMLSRELICAAKRIQRWYRQSPRNQRRIGYDAGVLSLLQATRLSTSRAESKVQMGRRLIAYYVARRWRSRKFWRRWHDLVADHILQNEMRTRASTLSSNTRSLDERMVKLLERIKIRFETQTCPARLVRLFRSYVERRECWNDAMRSLGNPFIHFDTYLREDDIPEFTPLSEFSRASIDVPIEGTEIAMVYHLTKQSAVIVTNSLGLRISDKPISISRRPLTTHFHNLCDYSVNYLIGNSPVLPTYPLYVSSSDTIALNKGYTVVQRVRIDIDLLAGLQAQFFSVKPSGTFMNMCKARVTAHNAGLLTPVPSDWEGQTFEDFEIVLNTIRSYAQQREREAIVESTMNIVDPVNTAGLY